MRPSLPSGRRLRALRRLVIAWMLMLVAAPVAAQREPAVRPGDVVDHAFAQPPFGTESVASLEALRGRAVLVVYWTPTCSACTGMAVPDALAYAERDDDVLAVVCVGYAIGTRRGMLALAAEKRWLRPGAPVLWTDEVPCDLGFFKEGMDPHGDHVRLPAVLLLDEAGRVVMAGGWSELRNGGRMQDTVADLVARLRGERAEVAPDVRRLWAKAGDGRAGEAIDRLAASSEGGRHPALAEYTAYWERQIARVGAELASGAVSDARSRAAAIEDALAGSTHMRPALEALRSVLGQGLDDAELEAGDALFSLRKKLAARGPSGTLRVQLERLADRFPGTRSAEFARRLAAAISGSADEAVRR